MMTRRISLAIIGLMMLSAASFAATFSANGGAGFSTIGTGAGDDYASLALAAADFNTYAGGCTGNYTFYITSALTEPANVAFANATNGYTVTFRPQGAPRTIYFSQTADNTGASGHWLVGVTTTAAYTLVKTDNFVIDGSLTEGGTTRDLTITHSASASYPNCRMIRIVGDCDNVQIKNCSVIALTTTANTSYAIEFCSRNQDSTNYIPDNGLVANCYVQNKDGNACQGIASSNSGTIATPAAQTGMVFRNNNVLARTRGIFLNQNAGTDVYGNTIKVRQTGNGNNSFGIYHLSSGGVNGFTINIYNNTIDELLTANVTAGDYGITGIALSGVPSGGQATFNIYNNMIAGYNYTGVTAVDQLYRGICITSAGGGTGINFRAFYNSINMPNVSIVTGATNGRAAGIKVNATTFVGSADIRNNIVKFNQAGTGAFNIYKGGASNLVCDYNDLCGTGNIGYYGAAYNSWANWQGAGFDLNGQQVDPTATSGGTWTSASNLHWTAKPTGLANGTPIASPISITTDIDGQTRSGTWPFPGCDEIPGGVPVEVEFFMVD